MLVGHFCHPTISITFSALDRDRKSPEFRSTVPVEGDVVAGRFQGTGIASVLDQASPSRTAVKAPRDDRPCGQPAIL